MAENRSRITIVILENRAAIAAILADLLGGVGYRARPAATIEEAFNLVQQNLPAVLLADLGMVRPPAQAQWQALQEWATEHEVAVLRFSCSPVPEGGLADLLVLRSPGDFAAVVDKVEAEWHKKQPLLGTTLVGMGCLREEELEVVLQVQRDLATVGRTYALGDLLLRLGLVSREALEEALRQQELP